VLILSVSFLIVIVHAQTQAERCHELCFKPPHKYSVGLFITSDKEGQGTQRSTQQAAIFKTYGYTTFVACTQIFFDIFLWVWQIHFLVLEAREKSAVAANTFIDIAGTNNFSRHC